MTYFNNLCLPRVDEIKNTAVLIVRIKKEEHGNRWGYVFKFLISTSDFKECHIWHYSICITLGYRNVGQLLEIPKKSASCLQNNLLWVELIPKLTPSVETRFISNYTKPTLTYTDWTFYCPSRLSFTHLYLMLIYLTPTRSTPRTKTVIFSLFRQYCHNYVYSLTIARKRSRKRLWCWS